MSGWDLPTAMSKHGFSSSIVHRKLSSLPSPHLFPCLGLTPVPPNLLRLSLDQVSPVLGEQDPALCLHLCSFQCLKGHRAGRRVKSPEGGQRPHLRQYRGSLREAQRLGLSATHLGLISTLSHPSALYSPLAPSEISMFLTS